MIIEDKYEDLCQRLHGIYTIPVNDGAGLLNGKDTFTRDFSSLVPPINLEAAMAISDLSKELAELQAKYDALVKEREEKENAKRN